MLGADLMELPDAALEEGKDALDSIGVNLPAHPFLFGMVHAVVGGIVVPDARVSPIMSGIRRPISRSGVGT
jgi:hypothetical protein